LARRRKLPPKDTVSGVDQLHVAHELGPARASFQHDLARMESFELSRWPTLTTVIPSRSTNNSMSFTWLLGSSAAVAFIEHDNVRVV
jgi:hypothetical protein